MRAPYTFFSTELRGGVQTVRRRLQNLLRPGQKRKGRLALIFLVAVVLLAGSIVVCHSPTPAPQVNQEVLSTLLAQDGALYQSVEILDSASLEGQTVVVSLAQHQEPDYYYTLAVHVLEGEPLSIRQEVLSLEGLSEAWARLLPDGKEGLLLHYLFPGYGEKPYQGGGLRYDGRDWTWVWPAPDDSVAYDTYWSAIASVNLNSPFLLLDHRYDTAEQILRRVLQETILPACQKDGVEIWGIRLLPQALDAIAVSAQQGEPSFPLLYLLDYRLLPADLGSALEAGYTADSQGWLLPNRAGIGIPVLALLDSQPLLCFQSRNQEEKAILAEATALLQQAADAPLPSGADLPATVGRDNYDPDTGLYYNEALDVGLCIPPTSHLKGQVLFRQEISQDGTPSLLLLSRPVHAWYLKYGGENTGEFLRFTLRGPEAAIGSQPMAPIPLYQHTNIMGRCLLSGRYWEVTDLDPLVPLPSISLSQSPWSHINSDNYFIVQSLFHNRDLPMDVDFTITRWPSEEDSPALRVGIGSQGDLGLGSPDSTQVSRRYIAQQGDYWLRETYDGLTVTSYVAGSDQTRTVTQVTAQSGAFYYGTYRRGVGIGTPAYEARLCYGGADYGYALPEPAGQQNFFLPSDDGYPQVSPASEGKPYRFFITQTEMGVPLPCTYRLEFFFTEDSNTGEDVISQIHLYADLLGGRDPFAPE
jgi:hypothetical protein